MIFKKNRDDARYFQNAFIAYLLIFNTVCITLLILRQVRGAGTEH